MVKIVNSVKIFIISIVRIISQDHYLQSKIVDEIYVLFSIKLKRSEYELLF